MVTIRKEQQKDIKAIRDVNELAFGQAEEAEIVDALRDVYDSLLSLVAVEDEKIVGHILFSMASIHDGDDVTVGMGLAPMAVLPEYQGRGIGSALVCGGLEMLKEWDFPFVIVLGHATYYPRFGFEKASAYGIQPQWDGVPDEAFMIYILNDDEMQGVCGVARYRDEFDAAM